METVTLAHQPPPTPPSGHGELHHYNLHHVLHHNAAAGGGYVYRPEDGAYLHSASQSGYASPNHMMQDLYMGHQYEMNHYPDIQDPRDVGLGIQYGAYAQPSSAYYHSDGNSYGGSPYMGHQTVSPPTPHSTTQSDGGRRTRSGRMIGRSTSPQTLKPSPTRVSKPKKSRAAKGEKAKTPKLTAPLSVLTKDMTVPVRNMEEWVNRSVETRKKEVEKRNGYITRPMNAFMLYRSAYAERTKQWCTQNNHQVVSSVSGESWPMEPPEVRQMYNEYARIERINHQNAHPTYKFSPSKPHAARKRKGTHSDDEDSELEDPDADWGTSHGKSRSRSSKKGKEAGYPSNNGITDRPFDQTFGPNNDGLNRSSWEAIHEGKPLPAAIGNASMSNQYYQTTVEPYYPGWGHGIEDVRVRPMQAPQPSVHFAQGIVGIPGGQHQEMLQLPSQTSTPVPISHESQVDPMLLSYEANQFGGQAAGQYNGSMSEFLLLLSACASKRLASS